jgi:phosphoenolpyruvate synthase/pyruvate phosphate dikinase
MKEKLEEIAVDYNVSLFPFFMLMKGLLNSRKIIGQSCYLPIKLENNNITFYYLPSNWKLAHQALVEKVKKNPEFLRTIFKKTDELGGRQIKYTQKIGKDIENKSDKTLNDYYQKYVQYNTEFYSYGALIPILDFNHTTFLSDEVNRILKEKKAGKYLETLTIPLKNTFVRKQDLALLKILTKLKKSKVLLTKFKSLQAGELVLFLKEKYPDFFNLIKRHTKKYCWVYYVYQGPAVDEIYFIEILQYFIKKRINPIKELENSSKNLKNARLKQGKILKRLSLSSYERQIIELTRDALFYKPYRRELQSWSYYNMEVILREIAKRLFLSLKQVRMMLPDEIRDALLKNKLDIKTINERMNLVIYGIIDNKIFCLTGTKARKFVQNNIKKKRINKKIKEINGSIAFKGKVRGRVKLINSIEDIPKMEDNDILVSFATSPNLMPAIRKAKAIITNEGGLTCHAAIVSRELRIPCIIGTKIATKVLKDGDRVEVDANKGMVKIIK